MSELLVVPNAIINLSSPLYNAKFARVFGSNLVLGDTDLYTVPAGKRAYIGSGFAYNPSAVGTVGFFTQVKVSGTYYRISGNQSRGPQSSIAITGSCSILNAGDILAVNTSTTSGLNVVFPVIEFDTSSPFRSGRLLGTSNGDNTVYTCPAGKIAQLVSFVGLFGEFNVAASNGSGFFITDGGGARNFYLNIVQSGNTPVDANRMLTLQTVVANSKSAFSLAMGTLNAGDFINVNVDVGNAAQSIWFGIVELPV